MGRSRRGRTQGAQGSRASGAQFLCSRPTIVAVLLFQQAFREGLYRRKELPSLFSSLLSLLGGPFSRLLPFFGRSFSRLLPFLGGPFAFLGQLMFEGFN